MLCRFALLATSLLVAASPLLAADYGAWKHRGTLALLTTPDGADLPEAAREENFPALVRLSAETFDFTQAGPDGADLRFSNDAGPLAYQIDRWDPANGEAAIWVRIPLIRGNDRQLITMHWGNADAGSESNGKGVFNASNGYAVVMHLGGDDPVKDEVGTVAPTDDGTTSTEGMIGAARRFERRQGVNCGEMIEGLPTGAGPCTTEAWFRPDVVNTIAVGWGNEQGQGKVITGVRSPPHVRVECYFSSADVAGQSRVTMAQWMHVVHAYREGESRLYVNGRLDGLSEGKNSVLNIRTPARMFLGGWYKNYQYVGDIDEVRISNAMRSADWVRLAYENQKPLQTLVGTLVPTGDALARAPETIAVEPKAIAVDEGQRFTATARADGAEKVYWILKRGDEESVVATDRFTYTLDAGRVTGDAAWVLRMKAVYPDRASVTDVPVTIRETIPEPEYALTAPQSWNGRDAIEVVPRFSNAEAMQAAGAGELHYQWTVSDGAVTKEIAADRLILRRSQFTGPIRVTSTIDNGGAAVTQTASIDVTEPESDAWVQRTPEADEKPEQGQFYARDDRNQGTLYYNGTLDAPAEAVVLKVFADDKPYETLERPLDAERRYAFTVKLKPGLVRYRVEFGVKRDGKEQVLETVGDLVCGDAYLISGQSNALATDTGDQAPPETHEWVRSYGGPTGRGNGADWVRNRMNKADSEGLARPNLWCQPVWKDRERKHEAELGWWGMELAKRLVESEQVPICIIQGAVGGTRIDEHQATPEDHADLATIYGRTLWRIQQARLTHGIRAVIWHQGENDQGADGPTGGYGWETYQPLFVDLSAAWKTDMPNIERYYMFQIWPNACAMGGRHGSGDRLREAQRTLPRLYSNMSVMSTLGIKPEGGCHYPLAGWGQFARLIQPMLERDFYDKPPAASIAPADLRRAAFSSAARDEITLEFDQPVRWHDALVSEFYLDDAGGQVVSGSATGNVVTLQLAAASTAAKITYLKERDWSQDRLIIGANDIAALTFCDVAIEPPASR